AFAHAFPAPARVSEPALPLLLAAVHEELDRPLVLLAPEDQDARDAAEGAAWFLGEDRVALLPSRGVHWASGLDPAPHLVGERARALDVLAAGGLVAASAARGGSSRFAAGWSTCFRPPGASRSASSSGETRSSRCGRSHPSRSVRSIRSSPL